jgi:hypothetical protein
MSRNTFWIIYLTCSAVVTAVVIHRLVTVGADWAGLLLAAVLLASTVLVVVAELRGGRRG